MAFPPPKYMPGQVRSQSLGPVGFDETMAMLNATAPKSPIQAPKDRGMFGRFMGALGGAKYGDEQMGWVERLGRGADGMNAIRDEQRMLKMAQEEEVKRREMAEQLGMYDGQAALFGMDPALALGERRDARNFQYQRGQDAKEEERFERQWLRDENRYETEQEFRERVQSFTEQNADRSYGLQRDQFGLQKDQFGLQKDQFGWQVGTDARDFTEGQRQFDMTYGLGRDELAAKTSSSGMSGIQPVPGLPAPRQIPLNVPDGVQSTLVRSDDALMDKATEVASAAEYMAQQSKRFLDRSKGYLPQGQGFVNDIGQALSMRTSDLQNITSDLGPKQREAGSGPMSDKDVEMYKQATVNVNNRRGVNEDIDQIYAANAAAAGEFAQFLQDYQAAYPIPGALRDARRLWNEYKNAEGNDFLTKDEKNERIMLNTARPSIYDWLAEREQGGKVEDPELDSLLNKYGAP